MAEAGLADTLEVLASGDIEALLQGYPPLNDLDPLPLDLELDGLPSGLQSTPSEGSYAALQQEASLEQQLGLDSLAASGSLGSGSPTLSSSLAPVPLPGAAAGLPSYEQQLPVTSQLPAFGSTALAAAVLGQGQALPLQQATQVPLPLGQLLAGNQQAQQPQKPSLQGQLGVQQEPPLLQQLEQQEEQPKRRGRKPKNPELLTEKQIKTREANRRFEQRQKQLMRETEEKLQATSADLDRARAQHESAKLAGSTLESMLGYKDDLLQTLSLANELDPQLRIKVPPPLVDVVRQLRVIEMFGADKLTRYAPPGYTEHLDANGYVVKAPPFEAVARDWQEIAFGLKRLLDEGRAAGSNKHGKAQHSAAQHAARESAPGQVVEVDSAKSCSEASLGRASSSGSQKSAGLGPCAALHSQQGQQAQHGRPLAGGCEAGASCTAGFTGHEEGSMQGAPQPDTPTGQAAAAGLSSGGSAGTAAGGAALVLDPWPGTITALEWVANECSHTGKVVDWELMTQGMEVEHGGEHYTFTSDQLLYMAALLKRVGLLCWSNVLLWPENINKLIALRLDNYQDVPSIEEELPRWRQIVQALCMSPEQLERLVGYHRDWMAGLKPALLERDASLKKLRELCAAGLGLGVTSSQLGATSGSLALADCNAALLRSGQIFNANCSVYASSLFHMFDFPVQSAKFVSLSWPTFPQLHVLGIAAAMELGLDMEVYTSFSELWGAQLHDHGQ